MPDQTSSEGSAPARFRYVIYAMAIAMCIICYGDRAALSVGMSGIAHDFALTPAGTGWVLSSFLWSYFILNLPSAIILDRFGPRRVGAAAVALWSLAMVLGSFCTGVVAFTLTRILLGVGEAPTFSLGNKVVRAWAPLRERGLMMTAFICGIPIGLAAGSFAGAWLIARFGWRPAFTALGILGLFWSIGWLFTHPERRTAPDATRARLISVPTVFRARSFWGVIVAQCCGNYANFLLMSWMPLMLRRILHLDLVQSGAYTAYAYLCAACLSIVAGRLGDVLMRGRAMEHGARRLVGALYYLCAASMGLVPFCHSAGAIVALMGVSLAFVMGGTGSNMALLADLLVEHELIGSVTGLALTFSNGLGIAAPVMTGYLLQATGSFNLVFFITAGVLLLGSLGALLIPGPQFHAVAARDAALKAAA